MNPTLDILGLGCVAVDDLLYVEAYPPPDAKVPVRRRERQCGGLTATALVAASRLGTRCGYAGILGDEELSRFVIERFHEEKVDVTYLRRRPGVRPIHSFIIVDESQKTRTIIYDLEGVCCAQPGWPDETVLRTLRVLYVDHYGIEGMTWAARIAREAGIPVVADFENDSGPGFAGLLELVDHLIVSREFAEKLTGVVHAPTAMTRLWRKGSHTVVVTCGADGCWFVSDETGSEPVHQPAFPVPVVDTTGCGDVFHGAYAAALARESPLLERIRFATAVAAIKATKHGGQAGIPDRRTVEAFLEKHRP
jgi:ribokinase